MEAYWKEWNDLEAKMVWNWDTLCEWDDVSSKARVDGSEIHFGFSFGIMVEKGSEYSVGDVRRCFKHRVVFRGNDVKDQDWNVALFLEMASTPATLEASRFSDMYSLLDPSHSTEGRDVDNCTCRLIWRVLPPISFYPKSCGRIRCRKCVALLSS